MGQDAICEKFISNPEFPVIARRTLINGRQLIFGGHFHSQLELLYVKRGEMELCCNNADCFIRAGELAILNPYDIHTAFSRSGLLYYYCFILDASFLSADPGSICTQKYIRPFQEGTIRFGNKTAVTAEQALILERLLRECRKQPPGYELAAKAHLLELFLGLYRTILQSPISHEERIARKKRAERFKVLFSYMDEHFDEDFTLEKMAAIVSYSPYHFSRTFHSLTGRTPMEYLKDVRIQKAVQLLKAGSSVGEAARSCGFNSPNYFCKVFREALGYPPSHYRPK